MASHDPLPTIPLLEEQLFLSRQTVEGDTVTVTSATHSRDVVVDETLRQTDVAVERVQVGHYVDAIPPVRVEGDVTILPIVEEVYVKLLFLREEVHVRRVTTTRRHTETVALRTQEAVVTRAPSVPETEENQQFESDT